VFDSKILNFHLEKSLYSVCELGSGKKWTLLCRASDHGFLETDFHSKCDNHSHTLTIIKSSHGYVFGGYTEQPWNESPRLYKSDNNAFIFSLINKDKRPIKLKIKHHKYAIYASFCGPTFGGDKYALYGDLHIQDNLRVGNSNLGQAYEHPTYAYGSDEAKGFLVGSFEFQVAEIEVFKRV
jgi:hypothetical protein